MANLQKTLSISELARSAGVTSKILRHWERIGLLPKAMRTHNGYRVFDPKVVDYITFIQKSKTVGFTLSEAKRVLELAGTGKNPCPEVVKWIDNKAAQVEEQIGSLKALQKQLKEFRRICSSTSVLTCFRPGELCCLIECLPNPTNGGSHEKAVRNRSHVVNHVGC